MKVGRDIITKVGFSNLGLLGGSLAMEPKAPSKTEKPMENNIRDFVLTSSVCSNNLLFFNVLEVCLFKLVVEINENESPKGCLERFEKQTKIIETQRN